MSFLDQVKTWISVTDDDTDDCRSECSYYSLPELDETDPVRRIPGFAVKIQAEAVPETPQLEPNYPHRYQNAEELPLRVEGPWLEHPLLSGGWYRSGQPGPARVVSSKPGVGYDVIYHPNRRVSWGAKKNTFAHARYRPRWSHRNNTPAKSQGWKDSPRNLASPSAIQAPSQFHHYSSPAIIHTERIQSPVGAYPFQPLLFTQQCVATQQHLVMQQHLVAQQQMAIQLYLNTQQYLVQPSPYY